MDVYTFSIRLGLTSHVFHDRGTSEIWSALSFPETSLWDLLESCLAHAPSTQGKFSCNFGGFLLCSCLLLRHLALQTQLCSQVSALSSVSSTHRRGCPLLGLHSPAMNARLTSCAFLFCRERSLPWFLFIACNCCLFKCLYLPSFYCCLQQEGESNVRHPILTRAGSQEVHLIKRN